MRGRTNRTEDAIKAGHLDNLLSSRGWKILCEILSKEEDILQTAINKVDPERSRTVYGAQDLDKAKMQMIKRIKKLAVIYRDNYALQKKQDKVEDSLEMGE